MVLEHRDVHVSRKVSNSLFPKSAPGCQKTRSWRNGSSLGRHIFSFQLPGWLTQASKKDFLLILMTCIFMFVFFPRQPILPVSGNTFGSLAKPHLSPVSVLIDWLPPSRKRSSCPYKTTFSPELWSCGVFFLFFAKLSLKNSQEL